ncbi:MAG: hypothetical protein HFH49_12825 [Lachnospiraceae bacterium]|nr:hypothetical protein [Lachnospiraceae bacterium]
MLKKSDVDRLEAHWAVSVIPEKDRNACFHTIEKIKTQKAVKHSKKLILHFPKTGRSIWQDWH